MKRILIVDDLESGRSQLEASLRGYGYDTVSARDGAEALAAARSQPPDLVISDIVLPVMDGFAFCREWRADAALRGISFIFYASSNKDAKDEELALASGADRFVLRPQEPQAMNKIIREALFDGMEKKLVELEASHRRLVEDACQREVMEEALRQSEERLRLIIETEPECVKLLGPDGTLRQMNPAGLKMIEADCFDDVADQCVYPLIVEGHRAQFQELTERVFRGESGTLEFQLTGRKGTTLWLETHATPLRNEQGGVAFLLAVTRDITLRKQAEVALRESQEQLQRLFQSSPLGTALYSALDGRILNVNARFLELMQCDLEEVVGRTGQELGVWCDPSTRDRLLERLQHEKQVHSFEARLRSKRGLEYDMLLSAQLIELPAGPVVMVQAHDITDRKRSEAALREKDRLLREVIDMVPHFIFAKDSQSRFLFVNRVAAEATGMSPEQLVGLSDLDIPHNREEAEAFMRDDREVIASGKPKFVPEEHLTDIAGRVRIHQTIKIPFLAPGTGEPALMGVAVDITDLKQAEGRVKESLSLLEATLESTADGILVVDGRGRMVRFNQKFVEMWRLPNEVLASGSDDAALQIVLAQLNEPEQFLNKVRELYGQPDVTSFDLLTFKDGRVFERYSQPHQLGEKIIGRVWSFRDVTGRKRAEERIVAFSDLGRKLSAAETAREAGEIIIEISDHLIGWDACVVDLYSAADDCIHSVLRKDTINGRRVDVRAAAGDQIPSPLARRVIEHGAELILRDELADMPADSVPFSDVSRPSLSLLVVPIRDGGRTVGILSIQSYRPKAYTSQDLEQLQALADHCSGALNRLRAEEEVRRLAAFPQLNPNPVLELRSDGTVNYFNEAARGLAGELGFTHPMEMLPPDAAAIVRACLGTGQTQQGPEVPYSKRVISWSFCPIPARGVVHCYASDVTERQQLEGQLRQAQKMEAVGTLAGGIAHDFNNLLGIMLGNAELARMDLAGRQSALMSIDEILRTGQRARELVQRILTFSRPQEKQLIPIQLQAVVNEVVHLLRSTLPAGINLTFQSAPTTPTVQADASQIHQVILNLATNAWHAMEGQIGRIEIRLEACQVDAGFCQAHPELRPGPHVRLSISDTGKGMDATTLGRIFEPFFTTKAPGQGTGLGLSVVHGIMRGHVGGITVESEPGRGTTFHLYFPAIAEIIGVPLLDPVTASTVRGHGERILYLDDEQPLVHLAKRSLERLGYRVTGYTHPAEALAAFSANPQDFDLVITDFNMPGLSGMEVARQLMSIRPDVPVTMLSGFLRQAEIDTARAMGIREIILKPNTVEELISVVERLLSAR